jgi:NAD(P)-dependent dehydrogenase (short-subunit alcohol dehydrogenase family)
MIARFGTPEDTARAVAFLTSPESSYITGTTALNRLQRRAVEYRPGSPIGQRSTTIQYSR